MLWVQLTRPVNVKKGDIVRFRIDNLRQFQPGNYQWLVTPLGKGREITKLEITNPMPPKPGMIFKILDVKETAKGCTLRAELIEGLDPAAWELINRAIQAVKDSHV